MTSIGMQQCFVDGPSLQPSTVHLLDARGQIIVKLVDRVVHYARTGAEMQKNIVEALWQPGIDFFQIEYPVPGHY